MTNGRHPASDADEPEAEAEAVRGLGLGRYVGRPLLLAFWCLVVWGTFYAILFVAAVANEGPSLAFRRALAGPDRIVGTANLVLAGGAAVVWIVVAIVVRRARTARRGD
jgi:predicted neutral ceramidase superfamily lipid hydrolase